MTTTTPAGHALGGLKNAASRAGLTWAEFHEKHSQGEKHCSACHAWHPHADFAIDRSRWDGLMPTCRVARNARQRALHIRVAADAKRPMGPPAMAPRDDDRVQARQRINVLVRTGHLPRPSTLACTDCGHLGDDRRHEYDHHLGYAAAHHYDVQPVCVPCHRQRDARRRRG